MVGTLVLLSQNEQQDRWLTVTEVAQRLGVDTMTVRRRIKSKKLRARREGKVYRILESDLEQYRAGGWNTPQQ